MTFVSVEFVSRTHVSPQYHVVFDDNFSTVQSMVNGEVPDKWTTLVQQSDEHRDEAGNDLTSLWTSQEFDPFHDEDHMKELPTTEFESTSQNELLMPTMPDLDELTCRHSKHERRAPDRFDPSASNTTIEKRFESYTFKQMLQQSDKNEFIMAMMKEIKGHEKRNYWHLFPRSEIPEGLKTILAVWSFKRKRFPDGRINKYKSRLCAHGGMQQ